jgi:hypothetical protein
MKSISVDDLSAGITEWYRNGHPVNYQAGGK